MTGFSIRWLAVTLALGLVTETGALGASPAPTRVKPKTVKPQTIRPTPTKKRVIRPAQRNAAGRTPVQLHPTPERLREIQSALAARGFWEGDPTGVWDDRSVAALKRFEESQQLNPDGKIDALALIALGLGPKREGRPFAVPTVSTPVNPAAQPQP